MEVLSTPGSFKHKVSSVLNRSSEFKSEHMFTGEETTCWNSDQGTPQFIIFDFLEAVTVSEIRIMFQGGFVGVSGLVEASVNPLDQYILLTTLDNNIENSNELQVLPLPPSANFQYLRITFTSSTDFYGRITIYKLEVYGQEV